MDYRPISLLHSIAKILSKLLALRLRPHMQSLISINQSENARVLRLATGKDIFHDTTTISSWIINWNIEIAMYIIIKKIKENFTFILGRKPITWFLFSPILVPFLALS